MSPTPARAVKRLQVAITRLRKALNADGAGAGAAPALRTATGGYRIAVAPGALDADVLQAHVRDGREALAAGEFARASGILREALALWRGPALADVAYEPFAQAAIRRLEDLRLAALEARIEADLHLGRHVALIGELETLLTRHPAREQLCTQLMVALYRCGRQADALDAYQRTRVHLTTELGLEPGPALKALQAQILRQEPALSLRERVARARLPKPASELIGRAQELAELSALFRVPELRLLTLTGPGGSGKTRLALELGWLLVKEFRDGVAFVDLGPVAGTEFVPATVAQALGLGADARTWGRLTDHLREKETLLVLDNFEHLLAAAPFVGELVRAAPDVRVLATSRAPLNLSDEREYPVPPLPVPRLERLPDLDSLEAYDAAAFFLSRARAARPDFVVSDEKTLILAEICIRLDGLPLALELAAPRLKVLSPEGLLDRLGRRLDLTGRARDVPDRQRTLRATLEWSHELLATEEQELFARLAVFRGAFTVAGVEAVTDRPDPIRVADSLQALADWNLVAVPPAPSGPRLRMLETIREFALERLSLSGAEHATRARHARFFLDLAERAEPELRGARQAEWLRELGDDNDNLREALAWFHAQGEIEFGFRLVGALWRFFQIRGQLAEGRAHVERLLAIDSDTAEPASRARALACAGRLAFFQGDYVAARRFLDQSFALQREVRDAAETALLIINFGMLASAEGHRDDARALLQQGADAFRAIPDAWGEANALAYLALVEQSTGDVEKARDVFDRSLELANAVGEKRMAAFSLMQLGAIAREEGDDVLAARLFEQALTVQRELTDTWSIASSSTNLAALALKRGDYDRAQTLLDHSLSLQWEAGDRPGIAASLERLGEVALERNEAGRAVHLIAAAQALYASIGTSPDAAGYAAHTTAVKRLRRLLDDEAFAERWAAGASLTPGEAVALAMDGTPAVK